MTADPIAYGKLARRGVPLIDGIEKVTGRAKYTADLDRANALVGRLLRSPDRKSTRLNSSHIQKSRMPSSA